MKKFTILTSVLALAACGGGGSNHSGGSAVPGGYVAPRPEVTAAVATSNAQITNLPSEVVVASNSNAPVSVVGSVTTTSGGVTYTSYRLDDINLFTADTTGNAYVNLELNETTGEIDAVRVVSGGAESGRITRDTNDSHYFTSPIFEYTPSGSDEAEFRVVDSGQTMADLNTLKTDKNLSAGGHWNYINERMVFNTYGKSVRDGGLQYSDFGYFNPTYKNKHKNLTAENIDAARAGTLDRGPSLDNKRTDDELNALVSRDNQLFAGGYAIEGTTMVETLTPENGAVYTGTALGRIYTSIGGGGEARKDLLDDWGVPHDMASTPGGPLDAYSDDAGRDMATSYTTEYASLSVGATGSQTLYMPFATHSDTTDTFYDVTVTKDTPDAAPSFTFSEGTPSEAQYQRNTAEANIQGSFRPGYYGVNTPVEAAGTARYKTDQELGTGITRNWEFQAAYGMKKN